MHIRDKIYIRGKWVQPRSTRTLDVINAATEEVMAKVPDGTVEDVADAAGGGA
jgi:aldehyde dehydrogenase (NAD+)